MPSEVLVLSPTPTGPVPSRFADLKDQVALILGRQLDSDSLYRCGQFINRAIKELNTRPWRQLLTTGTQLVTVVGTSTYSLDALFYRESIVQRLGSDGKPEYTLEFHDWESFQHRFARQVDTGKPYLYNIRNVDQDGIISLYPVPDAAYTHNVQYYKRIPQLVNNDDILAVPIEFENYIILRGQYYLMDLFHHERSELKGQQSNEALGNLIRQDELHPDKNSRVRLPVTRFTYGTNFIKVP